LAGESLTLEEVIIAFDWVLACRAARVVAWGASVEGFACWEKFIAEFDLEGAVFVSSTEGTREGIPRNRFCDVVAPSEARFHVLFQETKAVLTSDGCSKFSCDRVAADGELNDGGREERYHGAGGWMGCEFLSGEDVGVSVQLSWEGQVVIVGGVVLMAFHVCDVGGDGEAGE
jgi:hypothetical protein